MMIIELLLLGLSIYEYHTMKKKLTGAGSYYKVGPKLLDSSSLNVMSSAMEDESNVTNNNFSIRKTPGNTPGLY